RISVLLSLHIVNHSYNRQPYPDMRNLNIALPAPFLERLAALAQL
ncbi:hypothetical protein LCGC14_1719520, partial [marine sediment metagenome]